jgi:hypothetical protein
LCTTEGIGIGSGSSVQTDPSHASPGMASGMAPSTAEDNQGALPLTISGRFLTIFCKLVFLKVGRWKTRTEEGWC